MFRRSFRILPGFAIHLVWAAPFAKFMAVVVDATCDALQHIGISA
jgi:hypothetical protein